MTVEISQSLLPPPPPRASPHLIRIPRTPRTRHHHARDTRGLSEPHWQIQPRHPWSAEERPGPVTM
eukprot:2022311-Rhodomonas_salina.2